MVLNGLTLCQCTVNIDALEFKACPMAITDGRLELFTGTREAAFT
jgi:hypothetical protein